MASKDGETIDVLSVPEAAAPKDNVFDTQRNFGLLPLSVLNGSLELVNLIVWLLANQLTWQIIEVILLFEKFVKVFFGGFHFEVCFAIQILCFNVADTFGNARIQNDHISWDELVLLDFNNLTHEYLLPHLGHKFSGLYIVYFRQHVLVLFLIILMPFPVFECILYHGGKNNHD